MTRLTQRSVPDASLRAFRVEAPRACDAVGVSLRRAYARDACLPDDMAAMLGELDRVIGPKESER